MVVIFILIYVHQLNVDAIPLTIDLTLLNILRIVIKNQSIEKCYSNQFKKKTFTNLLS